MFWLGVEIGGAREVFLDPEIEPRIVSQITREREEDVRQDRILLDQRVGVRGKAMHLSPGLGVLLVRRRLAQYQD